MSQTGSNIDAAYAELKYNGLGEDTLREIIGYKDSAIKHLESAIESLRSQVEIKEKTIERQQLKLDRIIAILS